MITDSQVRIAFKVYMQDEDYEPSVAGMRDMRTALEAASVNGPWAPPKALGGWTAHSVCLRHPAHGTFWVYPGYGAGEIKAARCYLPSIDAQPVNEDIGEKYDTLEAAQAAVANRIAELDAQVAAPAQVSEQLEACR